MKKTLISALVFFILVFSIGVSVLYMREKKALLISEYPLDADTIAKAMQESGFHGTIQQDELIENPEFRSLFNIFSAENGKFIAGVSSGQKDGERALFISFPAFYSTNAILAEESESAIIFATHLFGGFKGAHQVYNRYIQDYGIVNTERIEYEPSQHAGLMPPTHEGESYWERNIGNINCQIRLVQPLLSEQQEYLSVIILTTDWDTFYSKRE